MGADNRGRWDEELHAQERAELVNLRAENLRPGRLQPAGWSDCGDRCPLHGASS